MVWEKRKLYDPATGLEGTVFGLMGGEWCLASGEWGLGY